MRKNLDLIQRRQKNGSRQIQRSQNVSKQESIQTVVKKSMQVNPRHLLPEMHDKTMFKAAVEYSMGKTITTRSLVDDESSIEKQVLDGKQNAQKRIGSPSDSRFKKIPIKDSSIKVQESF